MTSSLLPFGRSRETIQVQECLVVALQDQLVGIIAKSVFELIEQPNVQSIPNPPEFVAGVLNLRGEILSVLDLEAAFCGDLSETRTQIVEYAGVIVQTNKDRICFLVPKVLGIFSIKPETRTTEFPFIPRLNSICSIGEIALTPLEDPEKEEIVLMLDIETFLSNCQTKWANLPQEEHLSTSWSLPRKMERTQIKSTEEQEYLIITRNNYLYGIVTDHIVELIEKPTLQSLPNTPGFVAGVLNLRGEILSVLDLEAALMDESRAEGTQLNEPVGVILKFNENSVCCLVPEVLGVFPINQDCITEDFRFIPQLHNTSCISGIALTPVNDPEKSEIIEIIDIEQLLSTRSAEWDFSEVEKLSLSSRAIDLSKLTEEEISQLDLIAHDSFFERQEKLRHLKLDDFLLIQIGDHNLGIPLPFVQQALSTSIIRKSEDKLPILGWMNLEDTDIPVIDPRELLFTETSPQRPTDYAIFTLNLDQITFGMVVDNIHSILKVSLANPNEIQDELAQFDCLNHSLIENIAYPILDDEISSIPVLNISKLIQLLLDNKSVTNNILTQSKIRNERETKDNNSTE
jgi:chemotaxis signal transduction protein